MGNKNSLYNFFSDADLSLVAIATEKNATNVINVSHYTAILNLTFNHYKKHEMI